MKKLLLFLYAIIIFLHESVGQIVTPDSYQSYIWDFTRLSEADSSALMLHYSIKTRHSKSPFAFTTPLAKASYNSGYARGYNDGPVWKGKGMNAEIHGGFSGSAGPVSYSLQPVVYYAQNASFDLAPAVFPNINPYGYQFLDRDIPNKIDWVQRYGNDPIMKFHPGQSEIKLAFGGFSTSLTTQNYLYGPAIFSPILLGNNAPGMPKLNIGTNGPINVSYKDFQLGRFEGNLIYGLMKESDFFFNDQSLKEWSYYNALFLGFSPAIVPNLPIGFSKALYMNNRYWEPEDLIAAIVILDDGILDDGKDIPNDIFDQLASISANWNFPSVGFRAYMEFAKNDFNGNLRRVLVEPEHSRAYTIGFQKLFESPKSDLLVSYEHTNLSRDHSYVYRATPSFYEHYVNQQGYTSLGQLLGAGIGPGSNSDYFEFKSKHRQSGTVFGLFIQRIKFNKDYFMVNDPELDKRDSEYTVGGNFYLADDQLIYGINASYSYNFNRYYEVENDKQNV